MTQALLPGPSHAVVVRLTIGLDEVEPPVWRQLEVRGELTLDVVHELLQAAMGWEDYHLHRFWRGGHAYRPDEPRFLTEFDIAEGEEGIAESQVRLDQVLREPGDRLGYLYDFGDDWHHTITVDDVRPAAGDAPAATCVDGRGSCPPEDVGGPHMYSMLVAALGAAAPDEEQAELLDQYRDWLPEDFDPGRFDAAEATAAMAGAVDRSSAVADLMATPVVALRTVADRLAGDPLALLAELAQEAAASPAPPAADVETALRPWQVLLEAVGPDGVELTAAGRLRPAMVSSLARTLGVDRWWIGKVNREDQTGPVAALREAAQGLRLVRKYQGRLVRSPAGRRVASDPDALWDHLAAALPVGRGDFEQEASAVWLLCLASGRDDATSLAAGILTDAGWRIDAGTPVSPRAVREGAELTWDVVWVVQNAFRAVHPRDDAATTRAAEPVIRALAARAVLGR